MWNINPRCRDNHMRLDDHIVKILYQVFSKIHYRSIDIIKAVEVHSKEDVSPIGGIKVGEVWCQAVYVLVVGVLITWTRRHTEGQARPIKTHQTVRANLCKV